MSPRTRNVLRVNDVITLVLDSNPFEQHARRHVAQLIFEAPNRAIQGGMERSYGEFLSQGNGWRRKRSVR